MCETNLDGSINSGNFFVRVYLPLIQKVALESQKRKNTKNMDYYTEPNIYSVKVLLNVFIVHIFIQILNTETLPNKFSKNQTENDTC